MANLTPDKRAQMPQSQFAMPGKSFPMNDPLHQRLAIGGATRAFNAGNISAPTKDRIQNEAKAKLGDTAGATRQHALSIASATHLHNAGHLPTHQAAAIKDKARASINLLKRQQPPAPMASFGSLAPAMPPPMMGQGPNNGQPQ